MALWIRSATSVLVAASLVASVARAEEPTAEARKLAKSHFKRGLAHQSAGEYSQAIAEYQAAYALVPLPDLLFNIAQCHRLAGQRDNAIFYYRRYLEQVPEGGASDDARGHIQTLEAAAPPPAVTEPPAEPPREAVTPPPPPAEPTTSPWRWVGLSAAGVGVISLGVGVWQGLEVAEAERDVEGAMDEPYAGYFAERAAEGEAAEERMILFTGVGAALVVAGGLTWWLSGADEEPERGLSARPTFAPGLAGLSLSGRF